MNIKSTLKYPLTEVLRLIKFAASLSRADLSGVHVNVKNCRSGAIAGMAYMGVPKISNAPQDASNLVTLRIGHEREFPADNMVYEWVWKKNHATGGGWWEKGEPKHPYGGKTSPLLTYNTWQEGLVAVAAHEFNHIHQFQAGLPRSEVECEKVAEVAIAAYRQGGAS